MDMREFMRADLKPRTEDVEVAALAPWNDGVAPTFVVRGLDGPELARVREAAEKHRNIGATIEALVGGTDKEKIAAMRETMGIGDDLPEDYAKRLEMLVLGTVSPKLDLPAALKIAASFAVHFYHLTNRITELTGQGHTIPGKPAPSTETAASEQA